MTASNSADSRASSAAAVTLPLSCPVCSLRYPADFKVCPRDAVELRHVEPGDDPWIGSVLGQTFRITRAVGEGATARVYEACHERLASKRFAVKILHRAFAAQPLIVARFQREAEAAAAIEHPNIVSAYDVGRTGDGCPYLVTEFLDGSDLGSLLKRRGRLDVPEAVRIVRELCSALDAAHARGVVHRDLKPENVFMIGEGENSRVKVLDFGISKVLDSQAEALTRTGMIVGTPAYMSPEQAAGSAVDARTDVYAAGAILYRLVTGRPAFSGSDTAEVLSAVLTEEPRRPRAIDPSIPDTLELLIQRAMAKEPNERYPSMRALDEALKPFDVSDDECAARLPDSESNRAQQSGITRTASAAIETESTRELRRARPDLVVYSLLAYVWLAACGTDVILSILTANGVNAGPGRARVLGALLASAVVLSGPLVVWARHVMKNWNSSHFVAQSARFARRVALSAAFWYAATVLALRLTVAAAGLTGLDATAPRLSWCLLLASLAGGGVALLVTRARGKRAR